MGIICPSCGFDNIQGTDRCVECLHSLMQRDLPKPTKGDKFQHAMMTAPVSEIISDKELLVTSEKDSLDKIIGMLQKKNLRCVLVYRKQQLVGIVSNRDLLRKAASEEKDLSTMTVESVMTPSPEYVHVDDPIANAINKMAMGGFRNIPVVAHDGTPLSIVSIQDVLAYLSQRDKTI